ncbi:cell division protein PerM [Geodermatophilus sp. CPCC 205761]|uniref:cell division protein PerM n=1 Tax=Geodermatophilus sp. CPCC 205761 TaxID=2936597 RepID=UPI003EEF8B82
MTSLLARLSLAGRDPRAARRRAPVLAAVAAVAVSVLGLLGLGLAVVVVQTLDPAGGLPVAESARVAGALWLLAQGGGLVLGSGPLVLAPLLLTLVVAWGLSSAARGVVRAYDVGDGRTAVAVVAAVTGTHTLLTLLLGLAVDTPGADVDLLRCAVGGAVLALLAPGWGTVRESGLLDAALGRLPEPVRPLLRAVLAGLLAALALGFVMVAIALASDTEGHAALTRALGGAGAGAVGLIALGALLLPNAAVAAIGLAAGPGFVVGTGTLVSVHGVTLGAVPALPLLAALPDTQAVPLLAFASQVVPALAGLVAGGTVGRRLEQGGPVVAGLWGVLAGVLLGAACGLLAWVAGGSLGDGGLAEVGAPPVATGLAVAAQAGIAAAVGAVVSRWRSRG